MERTLLGWQTQPSGNLHEVVTEPIPECLEERKVKQELFVVGVESRSDFNVVV